VLLALVVLWSVEQPIRIVAPALNPITAARTRFKGISLLICAASLAPSRRSTSAPLRYRSQHLGGPR
jgi:hypothetical protein